MVPDDDYALLDCGDGRRLEAFGPLLVDRPAPSADAPRRTQARWAEAAVFRGGLGWQAADRAPVADAPAPIRIAGIVMEARPTQSGQVGLFPEHAANAAWIVDAVRARTAEPSADPPETLNLFAYTGLATLIAARAGARVTHLDASRPSVLWARRNAELSGLADHPIRWISDDALAFVRRESRRGRRYAGIILDPPSYGHGGRDGRVAWRIDERLDELLDACGGVAEPDAFWLLTAHTPGWAPDRLASALAVATDAAPAEVEGVHLWLEAESGAVLRLGATARLDPLRSERR